WLSWCFFFSSRRRHTRWPRDWSSDVCSSDLIERWRPGAQGAYDFRSHMSPVVVRTLSTGPPPFNFPSPVIVLGSPSSPSVMILRSEERRVGKEYRSRCVRDDKNK